MPKTVKFDSTVTGGGIVNLDVFIQSTLVSSPGMVVHYSQSLSDSTLIVKYQISGANGSGYTIKYACTSNGASKSDPANPTDVTGSIISGGYIEVILNIPL
ncbi:MAG TPA: hypothetical protein VK671_15130 [Mucilaginibacter sp.]|jgi:hypothetical protein|nr:hypothetical protein [Mucilaginibacter sp.]